MNTKCSGALQDAVLVVLALMTLVACGCSEQPVSATQQEAAGPSIHAPHNPLADGLAVADAPAALEQEGGGQNLDRGLVAALDGAGVEISTPIDVENVAAQQSTVSAAFNLTDKAGSVPASSEHATKPFPREPLFVGWPKPRVALLLTGRQFGFLEPCGCSGLENQNGGLVRRSTLLKELANKGWPVIPIDAGNQVRRFGRQAEIKFQITIEGLNTMGYQAIAFGPDDLRLPAPELVGVIAPVGDGPSKFVGANVSVIDPAFTLTHLVIEKGGKKIGITAILGARNQQLIQNADVMVRPAEEGLREVWPALAAARCDLYVLIAHATIEESVALAQKFPQFKLVATTGGAGEPTMAPERIDGTDSQMIQVGTKGMYAGVVGLFDDPTTPMRYQRIPLDARFPDSEQMLQLLSAYQDQLKAAGFEGLGVRPQPHPSGLEYIGSKACEDCHEDEYKIWKEGRDGHETRHAHAYATLLNPPKRSKIPRNFDPECISCHVVGWNPQKYFPYQSGFWSLEQTPELIDVGCEDCHGPGARHSAAENGDIEVEEDEMERTSSASGAVSRECRTEVPRVPRPGQQSRLPGTRCFRSVLGENQTRKGRQVIQHCAMN